MRVRFSDAMPQDLLSHSNKRLILRDACFPGWVARADGVETPIACVDTLFRAVALPAGAKEVTFSYEPQSVRLGFIVSATGVALCLALIALAGPFLHARVKGVAQAVS